MHVWLHELQQRMYHLIKFQYIAFKWDLNCMVRIVCYYSDSFLSVAHYAFAISSSLTLHFPQL